MLTTSSLVTEWYVWRTRHTRDPPPGYMYRPEVYGTRYTVGGRARAKRAHTMKVASKMVNLWPLESNLLVARCGSKLLSTVSNTSRWNPVSGCTSGLTRVKISAAVGYLTRLGLKNNPENVHRPAPWDSSGYFQELLCRALGWFMYIKWPKGLVEKLLIVEMFFSEDGGVRHPLIRNP